jgi:hypothetical protein
MKEMIFLAVLTIVLSLGVFGVRFDARSGLLSETHRPELAGGRTESRHVSGSSPYMRTERYK